MASASMQASTSSSTQIPTKYKCGTAHLRGIHNSLMRTRRSEMVNTDASILRGT